MTSSFRLAILAACLLGCSVSAHARVDDIPVTVKPGLPLILRPILAPNPEDASLSHLAHIEVYRQDKLVQTLNVPASGFSAGDLDPKLSSLNDIFSFPDCNFDGCKDLVVLSGNAILGNTDNHVWLFDPATERYVWSQELSDLVSPQFDTIHRLIHTVDRSQAGISYTSDTLGWSGRHLVILKEEDQEMEEGAQDNVVRVVRTVKSRLNGRLKTVRRTHLVVSKDGTTKVIREDKIR